MLGLFKKSLRHRLLAAFLLVGTVPYLLILLYFTYWGRSSIIEQQITRHAQLAEQSRQLIQNRLERLEREVEFLSQFELFDDMITQDADFRIARLLRLRSQIEQDSPILLQAIDLEGRVIASSKEASGSRSVDLRHITQNGGHLVEPDRVLFSMPLHASFDGRALGYLIIEYPVLNLMPLMVDAGHSSYAIASKERSLLGEMPLALEHSIALEGALQGYRLFYSIDEAKTLAFLKAFMAYLVVMLLFGIALIYFVSRHLSRQITRPIMELTQAAEEIIATQDFDLRVGSISTDETGSLAIMFNRLVETTGLALNTLATENQLRMRRFIDLTDMFNHITQIDDEHDCIDVSIDKLRSVLPFPMHFVTSSTALSEAAISVPLYLSDISTKEHLIYGYLVIEKERFDDELEQRFFESVGAMIMVQVERISLFKKIQAASEAKSTFISGMSHELRTPLNAIIGFSQYLIAYEALSDEQMDTVGKIEKAAHHLLHLINDILDIAKIEAGKMDVLKRDVAIAPLIEECVDIITPLADERDLSMEPRIETLRDVHLKTDPKLFKQILINLLSNAVKFTDSGGIVLDTERSGHRLTIRIIDTGIGIAPEDLPKVFDAFTQIKARRGTSQTGTGLGLSLSRHLATSIDANVVLKSEGKGLGSMAEFSFDL